MKKVNLYFIKSDGGEILVAENIDEVKIGSNIYDYLDSIHYHYNTFYIRMFKTDTGTRFDFGSHYDFFESREVK